uniref:NADH-ubiquinone oxidoreductase chain 4 n=1 Tax=Amegilla calceifera TaxID=597987 RepID=A0A7U0M7Z4_9HYME|nr:NADH dehydrogenase subunit 4 [Amegilla calceifera]QQX28007.1 NADH dehydrogenase subunit 4 [Amegilla calceifera]
MFELVMPMLMLMIMIYNINKYLISNFMLMMTMMSMFKLSLVNWFDMNQFTNTGSNLYSMGLTMLTIWVMSLILMNSVNEMYSSMLMLSIILMTMSLIMNFNSMNLMLFYFLFEMNLIIIFMMIMKWGYSMMRVTASFYLMFYTLIFSMPMIIVILYIKYINNNLSFPILDMKKININKLIQLYFLMAFLVKIPMYTIHQWLLKAHVEASYLGSMILAAIMLKLGGYGLIRSISMFTLKFNHMYSMLIYISMFGSIMLSMLCLRQIDMKIIVASSSIIHMAIMISGLMTMLKSSIMGGYMMMLAHGLCSSGMFYMINTIYKFTSSRLMFINKGLSMLMPSMALMWFMLCSSNAAAPMSMNLSSEIMLIMGIMSWMKYFIVIISFYCLLSFSYSIYLYSYTQHGKSNVLKFFKMTNNSLMEYLTMLLHWVPLNTLILCMYMFY